MEIIPREDIFIKSGNVMAKGFLSLDDGSVEIDVGTTLVKETDDKDPDLAEQRQSLLEDGIIAEQDGVLQFVKPYTFYSKYSNSTALSAAASIIMYGNRSGWNTWTDETGKSLSENEKLRNRFSYMNSDEQEEYLAQMELIKGNSFDALNKTQYGRLVFWSKFHEALKKSGQFNPKKVGKHHYCDLPIGNVQSYISITLISTENYIGVSLYIPNNKDLFDKLYTHKDEIESAAKGISMEWMRMEGKKASRIFTRIDGLNIDNHDNYDSLVLQTIERAARIRDVFVPFISEALK